MDAIQQLKERLLRHPELRFIVTPSSIAVEAPSANGFSVSFHSSSDGHTVHVDGWHEHFANAAEALDCFAFAFSGLCRLAITYRGAMPVRWVLEREVDGVWQAESQVGLFFVPFWLRARVEYRQNPNLLTAA